MGWSAAYVVFMTGVPAVVAVLTGLRLLALRHMPGPYSRRLRPGRAAWLAAAAWLVFFGYATVSAVRYLVRPWPAEHITGGGQVLVNTLRDYLPGTVAAVLLFAAVRHYTGTRRDRAGISWPVPGVRPTRQLVGWTLAGYLACGLFASWVEWTEHGAPGPWDVPGLQGGEPWMAVDGVLSAIRAAVTEEIVVVAVPVMLARAAGHRIGPLVVTVLLAARLSYHLYYGWGSIGVVVWGGLFLWIFLQRGTLWPLLAAHFVFDAVNGGLAAAGYDTAWRATTLSLVTGAAGYLLIESLCVWHRRRRRFINWQRASGDLLAGYAARCSRLASRQVALEPRLRETRAAHASKTRKGRYVIWVGPGFVDFGVAAAEAILIREAERICVGAVDQAPLTPWARWPLRIALLALTVTAFGSLAAGFSGRAGGEQLAASAAVGAVALALVGEAIGRRRVQHLEDAARARTEAVVGAAALRLVRVEMYRQADPLTAPLVQYVESRLAVRSTVGAASGDR